MVCCTPVDLKDPVTARQVHAVYQRAHAQEARLLAQGDVAANAWSSDAFCASGLFCLAAYQDAQIVGALCVGPDDEGDQVCIASLFVHPAHQRSGVARHLVGSLIARSNGIAISVSVAEANGPAVALYQALGFQTYRRGTLGDTNVSMAKLRRSAT
jgi:ribosomal protein S18 acetylase RimI-like enzyme